MQKIFKDYLFGKHILVHESGVKCEDAFETLFALANLFNIRITEGQALATKDMIETASEQIGVDVPAPFYTGFPQSVRALSKDALLFDQLVHYTVTYGFGNFSEAGHSLLEEKFERAAFKEDCEIKDFVILTEQEAEIKMTIPEGKQLKEIAGIIADKTGNSTIIKTLKTNGKISKKRYFRVRFP